MLYIIHILFFLLLFYIKAEPSLPSYDLDAGDWPEGTTNDKKTVDNLMDRWFIDITDAKCKPFEYRGTKGNFNNFPSQKLCERHLTSNLTQVEKLAGCQQKSENNEHYGACNGNKNTDVEKYYFDKNEVTCTKFYYNGCGGTFNRYDSEEECKFYCFNQKNGGLSQDIFRNKVTGNDATKFAVPNYLDCHLNPDVKTFNPTTKVIAIVKEKKCVYASVDVEPQRGFFETLRECVKNCFPYYNNDTQGPDKPEYKRKIAACNSNTPHQYASINDESDKIKYYYDKDNKKCKRFETGPVSSNNDNFDKTKNNFPTLDLCHSYCGTDHYPDTIFTEKTCKMEKAGNVSKDTDATYKVKRYYYTEESNGQVKKCKTFFYKGINGNTNNFKTFSECQNVCGNNMRPGETIQNDTSDTDN